MSASPRLPPLFFRLIGGLIAIHASMATTRVAGTLWALREGHDERVVGVLLSLFAVAPIVMALWAGRLADRHGLQRPARLGVAMALVGAAAAAWHPSLITVGLASLLTGGSLSVAAVAIQREAGLLGQDGHDLKQVFSWIALGPALSNVVAPLTTGFIIDHAGLRWAFAWGLAFPVLAWLLLAGAGRGAGATVAASHASHESPSVWPLLRMPAIRVLLFINLAMAAAWDAHTFAVPVVGHERQFSASEIGFILSAFAVASTAVRLFIVAWGRRLDERLMLRGAMAVAAAVLAVYAFLPGVWGLMLGSVLMGLVLGSVQPMVLSMLHQVTPPDRHGQAVGLRMVVTSAATVGLPVLYGLMSASLSLAAPLWVIAALLLAAQWPVQRAWR